MRNLITSIFRRPDDTRSTVSVDVDLTAQYFNYAMMDRITDALADKAVKEIWRKHGAVILRKVDKKTIGNLTVKKLSALIAKELRSTP